MTEVKGNGKSKKQMTAKRLIREAERASTGTPDLLEVLGRLPEGLTYTIDLFLTEFDYINNVTSNRATALRTLAAFVSALNRSVESAEKSA
jgi:hypothetical protein